MTAIRRAMTALLRTFDRTPVCAVLTEDGKAITVHHDWRPSRTARRILARVPARWRGFPVVLRKTSERDRRALQERNRARYPALA